MKAILLGTILAFGTHAQISVKQEIKQLLADFSYETDRTNDQRSLLRAKNMLARALELLRGGSTTPDPYPRPRNGLTCVARDNDGRNPWMLGARDPRDLQVKKLPQSVLGELNQCEMAKDNAIISGRSIYVCVSKDNDGRQPFSVYHYKDSVLAQKVNNLGSLEDCVSSLQAAYASPYALGFCGTKDNDGASPYVYMTVDAESGAVQRSGYYSTLEECQRLAKKK